MEPTTKIAAFFHPDFTVGTGISTVHTLYALAGFTADRELGFAALTLPRRLICSNFLNYTPIGVFII